MSEHEHEFDEAPEVGVVACCVDRKCTEWAIGTGTGWRELTTNERTNLTIFQMEDLILADVAKIIHGERWREWFHKVRG